MNKNSAFFIVEVYKCALITRSVTRTENCNNFTGFFKLNHWLSLLDKINSGSKDKTQFINFK